MTRTTLIVGYGNPLRGDDGLGQAVARAFAGEAAIDGVEALACHQLAPELAERFGAISVVALQAGPARPARLGHHFEPSELLGMAQRLYERSPEAYLVTVGAGSFELGEELSPPVARALPEVIVTVRRLALAPPRSA
jgi:Ni,Fe-hydrogenase maturation factor